MDLDNLLLPQVPFDGEAAAAQKDKGPLITGRTQIVDTDALLKKQNRRAIAVAADGFFVRDPVNNVVFCPEGEVLHKKSVKRNGYTRYCNKAACRHCKHKCCNSPHKEVDFSPRKNIMPTPQRRQELKRGYL